MATKILPCDSSRRERLPAQDAPREALMDCIRRCTPVKRACGTNLAAKLAQRVSGETLSEREIDVLKLLAQGKSNKEIGSALFISEGTVKSHVKASSRR